MQEEFKKEELIEERTELEKEESIIRNIIQTSDALKRDNHNFEFAEFDLVDYYVYQIKANQSKLDYLLKLAKAKGITLDMINQMKYKFSEEEEVG